MKSHRRIFFFILACLLLIQVPANMISAYAADTDAVVAAADGAVENTEQTDAGLSDGVQLAIFLSVVLFICIVAVIVAVNSVMVSLPIIDFFE